MDRLGDVLGLAPGRLWVKRDDCTGLGGGGNKVRKLELLCADALAQGCDLLVTGGGRQSNHVRLTAAAANRLGLDCTIVLGSPEPKVPTGNVVLDHVLQPRIVWAGDLGYDAMEAAIRDEAARLDASGRHAYAIPVGGASTVGALGYVLAARELEGQLDDIALVVTADGSGGTHAGLVAGLGSFDRVLGVDTGARPDVATAVPAKVREVVAAFELPSPSGECDVDTEQVGGEYGAPTDGCREALDLAARCEGLLLDPVYSGKAMAGLVAAARAGALPRDGRIVFLHTGGLPAIFAARYADWVRHVPR
jgi:1-aminocyclopropane-1-carboxylate deaminase/D-cysteine desulfhydrase-like pyridoxal-dependent ACC family enzyme